MKPIRLVQLVAQLTVLVTLLVAATQLQGQPITTNLSYSFAATLSKKVGSIPLSYYKMTAKKTQSFDDEGAEITRYMGITATGTNIIRQETYIKEQEDQEYRRVRIVDIFYNEYAPGGMQTNEVEEVTSLPQYAYPSEDWLVGDRVVASYNHKLVYSGTFALTYDNSQNLSPWIIKHYMEGNGGAYETVLRVDAKGTATFSPTLREARKETGSSFSWVYFQGFEWHEDNFIID